MARTSAPKKAPVSDTSSNRSDVSKRSQRIAK